MKLPRTKIVCTIGPASNTAETITALIENGMSVARLNFSHSTHQEHATMIHNIRAASKHVGRPVAILQDLGGPKIRVGEIPTPGLQLDAGQTIMLSSELKATGENCIPVSYNELPAQVKVGDRILLADGIMELTVEQTTPKEAVCRVITGGLLTSHKGINLPTSTLDIPALTEKDRRDLLFGLDMGVDFVALSFVRSAADIHIVKKIIHRQNKQTPVIAKIEKHEALDNVDAILTAADAVMLARGDLGVEIPLENVPNIQKMVAAKANTLGKPVIIATQMLRSMVTSPRPTRAEAADVANGVLDGADAVMLSEETAIGQYPLNAVHYMVRIALSAEQAYPHQKYMQLPTHKGVSESVAHAACIVADHLNAAAIAATTRSGFTAAQIARFRPAQPIIALSPDEIAVRQLALYWGCSPCYMPNIEDTDEMVEKAATTTLEKGHVHKGDNVVITAGRHVWETGTTNMLWVKTL